MSYGVVPVSVRSNYRVSSRKLLMNTVLLLVAATFLLSISVNTHRARQQIQTSVQHFHEAAGVANAALHQAGNHHTAADTVGKRKFVQSDADQARDITRANIERNKPPQAAAKAAVTAAATDIGPATSSLAAQDAASAKQQQTEASVTAGTMPQQQQQQQQAGNATAWQELRSAPQMGVGYNASGAIPRIIHVNYISGPQQLLTDALKPLSHFRKEWWLSCKTHHPTWTHMFWDEAACDKLLRERYPWFMTTWQTLGNSTVLKSDAIRPFILHAYGGVYLDLDSECFTDMSPWINGAQLVMQAEVGHTINNAQMASVSGHPVWSHFQRAIQARVAAGKRWPLETTGPHLLTDIVRALTGNLKSDLPGAYPLPDGSRLAVYGPKQWFTPCAWNDWTCTVQLARNRPLIRARSKAAVTAATAQALAARATAAPAVVAAATGGVHVQHVLTAVQPQPLVTSSPALRSNASFAATPQQGMTEAAQSTHQTQLMSISAAVAAGFPVMLGVHGVAGVHHFSGSWLGLDGSKSLSLRKEGVSGVLTFLYNGTGFVQQQCSQLKLVPDTLAMSLSSSGDGGGSGASSSSNNGGLHSALAVPVCWDSIAAAAAAGSCTVLSVRTRPHCRDSRLTPGVAAQQQHQQHGSDPISNMGRTPQHWLTAELALARAGCFIKLVTAEPVDLSQLILSDTHLLQLQQQQEQHEQGLSLASQPGSTSSNNDAKTLWARISQVTAVLGVSHDPFAEPPVHTLDTLVASELGAQRLTMLLLNLHSPQPAGCAWVAVADDPQTADASSGRSSSSASSCVLDILNQLYVSSSTVLQQVDNLVLTLPAVDKSSAHKAFAAYQHLFQESGFVGYYHAHVSKVIAGASSTGSRAADMGRDMLTLGLTRA